MRSVAWTDVVQGLLLVGGMLITGVSAIAVIGGPEAFFAAVSRLPPHSLSVPGTTGYWHPEILFTTALFASLGSMIQPAQWMRFYAARSAQVLRRCALIFAVVLTGCFFFGVMLVGLGGQVLYPLIDESGAYRTDIAGRVLPHPHVGQTTTQFDQILVVVLKNHLPELLGPSGVILTALILVTIMAAAMSTADSNLHALSALLTPDVYKQFVRPGASQFECAWVGRTVIALATLVALTAVIWGHRSTHNPLGMIVILGLLAIAFSTQLLPLTIDILFLRRGRREGAIGGLIVVFTLSPLFPFAMSNTVAETFGAMRRTADSGAWGLVANTLTFSLVSWCRSRQ